MPRPLAFAPALALSLAVALPASPGLPGLDSLPPEAPAPQAAPAEGVPVPAFPLPATGARKAAFATLHAETPARTSIDDILRLERTAQTVDQAIAYKTKGLPLVQGLQDFVHLTQAVVDSPSDAYRSAISGFIVQHVDAFVDTGEDLPALAVLEGRARTVDDAEAIKTAGLRAADGLAEFRELVRFQVADPSKAYRQMVSRFIAQHVVSQVRPGDTVTQILELEGLCAVVDQAMEVKKAGLRLVRDTAAYRRLMRLAYSNPSKAYKDARSRFMVRHVARGIFPATAVEQILDLEALALTVDDAIAVKEAGMVAVDSLDELMALGVPAVANPSPAYKQAIAAFIARHADDFVGGA